MPREGEAVLSLVEEVVEITGTAERKSRTAKRPSSTEAAVECQMAQACSEFATSLTIARRTPAGRLKTRSRPLALTEALSATDRAALVTHGACIGLVPRSPSDEECTTGGHDQSGSKGVADLVRQNVER